MKWKFIGPPTVMVNPPSKNNKCMDNNEILDVMYTVGAAMVGHLEELFGPHEAWWDLVEGGWLREIHTPIGPVVGLDSRARRATPDAPYLTGPATMTHQAFLLRAIHQLESERYRCQGFNVKKSGLRKGARTSVALSATMNVPVEQRRHILASYPEQALRANSLGQPLLYASSQPGGMKLPRVHRLMKTHNGEAWRAPLLIAVLDDTKLAPLARRANIKARAGQNHAVPIGDFTYRYDVVRIVQVRLPECRR